MNLLDALKQATEADLESISARVAELEAELDGLRELKRLLEVKFGIRKKPGAHLRNGGGRRKTAATDAPGDAASDGQPQLSATDQHRLNIKRYLMANGPQSQGSIVKQCGVPAGSITAVLKHPMFKHTAKGVELTSAAY